MGKALFVSAAALLIGLVYLAFGAESKAIINISGDDLSDGFIKHNLGADFRKMRDVEDVTIFASTDQKDPKRSLFNAYERARAQNSEFTEARLTWPECSCRNVPFVSANNRFTRQVLGGWANLKVDTWTYGAGGCLTTILPSGVYLNAFERWTHTVAIKEEGLKAHVSPDLRLAYVTGDLYSILSGPIGLSSEPQSDQQEDGAGADQEGRPESVISHSLGGFIHGLRGRIHALLGDQVFFLALASFFLLPFAGIGGGLILDHVDRNRKRKLVGWCLLCVCAPLGLGGLILCLP
ncbi:hypothetical protein [Rhizobium sp. LjRoot254]|uniref:hypothetical protein n=1 Tax=Rhizobium sp. LjRoot254 TaxID=3342297 RepID=UPI003ECDAAB7